MQCGNAVSRNAAEIVAQFVFGPFFGKRIDTSMGFTPAAGVPMSTRSGDLDPGLAWYFAQTERMTAQQFHKMINLQSGLLGIQFDEMRNTAGEPVISADGSRVQVRVIRTDEDVVIVKAVFRILQETETSRHPPSP